MRPVRLAVLAAWATLAAVVPAGALINPNYTPVDLVRDSGRILVLRATAPEGGTVKAEVVEVLAGEAPASKALTFTADGDAGDRVASAFGRAESALAVMFVEKKPTGGVLGGAVEIGTTWLGLAQGDTSGAWRLGEDPKQLETVWGGSARYLVPAVRYVLDDPRAAFPVEAELEWGDQLSLGALDGPAHGYLPTAAGVIVLTAGGDRVYAPGELGEPVDVTDRLGLATASKAMAAGDVTGDGRWDLVAWDAAHLHVVARTEDGRFAARTRAHPLAACRSLSAVGRTVVVGADDGVTLFDFGADSITPRRLDGPGGVCTVADFTEDGRPDVLAVSAKGLALYPGTSGEICAFGPPAFTPLATVTRPRHVVCGDFDSDGRLDLVVAGEGGAVVVARTAGGWRNVMAETGELVAAAGLGEHGGTVTAACPSDLNGDARQAVALFYAGTAPGLFFSRGFASFGIARSLQFSEADGEAVAALGRGQQTGVVHDLSGDGAPDLLAVDREGGVWAMLGDPLNTRRFRVEAEVTGNAPLTVTVTLGGRRLGVWVLRPGQPRTIAVPRAGKATFSWETPDGEARTRDVVVAGPTRVKL